jgi:transcriptional regulator with XRE-family HTH domain
VATIGERIRDARGRKGLTQEQLAADVGVQRGAVARWEKGGRAPRGEFLTKIARALDTTAEQLQGDAPARTADVEAYRLGLYEAAKRLRELAQELEGGGPKVDARSVKTGHHSRKRVGVHGVKQVRQDVDRSLKVSRGRNLDRLPEK